MTDIRYQDPAASRVGGESLWAARMVMLSDYSAELTGARDGHRARSRDPCLHETAREENKPLYCIHATVLHLRAIKILSSNFEN
jgi:hypothetical protein